MKLFLFFFLFSYYTFAQNFSSQVIDAQNLEPIPYATLFCSQKLIGTYADSAGFFIFPAAQKSDSIKISSIGYIPLTQTIENLEGNKIKLRKDTIQLQEVSIWSKKWTKTKNFGYFKPYIGFQSVHYNINSLAIMTVFIENTTQKEGIIENITYKFAAEKSNIAKVFKLRVRIFSNKSDKPNQDLLQESIIFDVKPTDKEKTITLIDKNINFPSEGLWLGIEILAYTNLKDEYIIAKLGKYGRGSKENIAPYIRCFRDKPENIGGMVYQYGKWRVLGDKLRPITPLFSLKAVY